MCADIRFHKIYWNWPDGDIHDSEAKLFFNFVRYFSTLWDVFQLREIFSNFVRHLSTSWDIFQLREIFSTSWDICQLCEIFFNFVRYLGKVSKTYLRNPSSWFFVRYLYHCKILREIFINVGSKIISARYIME